MKRYNVPRWANLVDQRDRKSDRVILTVRGVETGNAAALRNSGGLSNTIPCDLQFGDRKMHRRKR
jgi:hypothetical protein